MPNKSKITTNFTAGELSPRLLGRTDLKKYSNGARTMENFLIQVHGGIERRPGTRYVATTFTPVIAASPPRLVEFQFNVDQSYVLEFGVTHSGAGDRGYIRFLRLDSNGDPILLIDDGTTDPTILSGLPFRDTELPELQFTQSADVLYIFSPTRKPYVLKRTGADDDDADNWTYEAYEFNDGPYMPMNSDEDITITATNTSKDANPITVVSQGAGIFAATDVGRTIRFEDDSTGYDIKGAHPGVWDSDDGKWTTPASIFVDDDGAMMLIAGEDQSDGFNVEFLKVTAGLPQLNDTVYSCRNFVECDTGEGEPANTTKFYIYHPETGQAVGWDDLSDVEDFFATEINGQARFERASFVGWGRISAFTNANAVGFTIVDELPTANKTTNFRLGAWSDTTGYPRTARFYQDRLWTASSTDEPQTIWSTGTGTYNCYSPTTVKEGLVLDSSAITVTLADAQVNQIKYLAGDTSGLIILTSGGEWLGRATNPQSPLTPTDMGFQKSGSNGSASGVVPIRSGTSLLYVQRDGKVVRELTFEFGQDRFVSPNITLLSEHITGTGLVDGAYQQGRSNRIWYVREDGQLVTLTYEKHEEVMGWHRQKLAQSNGTDPTVLSVATTLDSATDNIWVLVKRDIDGTDAYFIEMMEQPLEATDDHDTAFYLDSGLSGYDASGSQTWTGLNHLIGEDVYVLADAVTLGPFTVSVSGGIDLGSGNTPDRVVIGLKYTSVMETLPIILAPSKYLDPKGKLKRAFKYFINLYRTLGGKVGTPEQVYPIEYPATSSTVLNTQMIEFNAPDNSQRESIVRYEQSDAQPATLLSIVSEFNVGEN